MSRHSIRATIAGKEATIVIGWDRPLEYYHMVIELDGEYIWSNLNLVEGTSFTNPDFYHAVLEGFGVVLPTALRDELECDRLESPGANKVKDWGQIGNNTQAERSTAG